MRKKAARILFLIIFLFPLKSYANINVVFTIDNNYPIYTMLLINSILKNNISNSKYTFWVIEPDITPKNKAKMKKFVEDFGQEINFIDIVFFNILQNVVSYTNNRNSFYEII